jgi:hypothetical protein
MFVVRLTQTNSTSLHNENPIRRNNTPKGPFPHYSARMDTTITRDLPIREGEAPYRVGRPFSSSDFWINNFIFGTVISSTETHTTTRPECWVDQHRFLVYMREVYPNENFSLRDLESIWIAEGLKGESANIVGRRPNITHSANFSVDQTQGGNILSVDGRVIGSVSISSITRADLYRRAHNYLTDANHRTAGANVDFQTITFETTDMDLGRIRGKYAFLVVYGGQRYRVTSTFTIDIHDAQARIRFDDTVINRRDGTLATHIQSVVDSARVDIVRFTDNLISSITS